MKKRMILCTGILFTVAGCATVTPPPQVVDAPVSRSQQAAAQIAASQPQERIFKRKIAIGRFSNETRYGRMFLADANLDPLGKQASDILASDLVKSHKFLVFERQDINRVLAEQKLLKDANLIGVDALILGSITEFGRSVSGKVGFLSATKVQTARAKVDIRLVDVHTGRVFFSTSGVGEASTESGEIAGYGSKAAYDGTLNDRAISAAISDVMGSLMNKLQERPWRSDILKVAGNQVFISGGQRQGLKIGDALKVLQEGEKVTSQQSGFEITLPPHPIGRLKIVSFFGDSESNEGAICDLISGTAKSSKGSNVYVAGVQGASN